MHILKLYKSILIVAGLLILSGGVSHGEPSIHENWFQGSIRTPKNIKPASEKEQILIAIVDDGVRITHEDLAGFIWKNPKEIPQNKIDDDGNGYVDDVHGWDVADNNNTLTPPKNRLKEFYHGTFLSGIVAQIAKRAYGDSSSDFIRIMPVKALSDRANQTYIKDGYKGIEYAISAGADIIICAWGVGHISPDESRILQKARDKGILIVSSAGNFPEQREQYPAADDTVLAVTALNRENKKPENSNYGLFVDLSAPGVDIVSTSAASDTTYRTGEGTSHSTAMVAAAAALVKLEYPSYSTEKIKACLKSSAEGTDSFNPEQYSAKLGAGKLNIEEALECGLFTRETKDTNRLLNAQGYLYSSGPRGETVTWTIEPHGVFKGLRFKPVSIQGRAGKSTLNFYADKSPVSEPLQSYPLAGLPEEIYLPGTKAYVVFEPENAADKLDWLLEYKAEPINFSRLYCRDTEYLDLEGSFNDGSGPNNYSLNSSCKWLITAPEGKVIDIKFSDFDTEGKIDLIYFFNGSGTHEEIMAIFSGPDIPPELTTWGNQVLVWFVTDGQNQGKGWKAEYRFKDPLSKVDRD